MTSEQIKALFDNMTIDEQYKAVQVLEAFFSMLPSDIVADFYIEYMEKDNEQFYSILSRTENIYHDGKFEPYELEGYTIDELDMDKKWFARVDGVISTDIKKYIPIQETADYYIDCLKRGDIYD